MTRYQQLQERRERLIALNGKNDYVTMHGRNPNPRSEQYLNCLLQIRIECAKLQREHDKKFNKSNYKFTAI